MMKQNRTEQLLWEPDYANDLAKLLRETISGEVRFDHGSRAAYSTDGSNYRQIPIGLVVPKSIDDVINTVAACRKFDAPITSRGGGTSLAGQCCNVAVVIDYSKYMDQVLEIDPENRLARVQPGCKLDTLRKQAKKHGLSFGPDPATHNHNTLGGMIGNNSCGIHSVMSEFYGPGPLTKHNVHELDILLYEGTRLTVGRLTQNELDAKLKGNDREAHIYQQLHEMRNNYLDVIQSKFPDIPRRVSGYNLDALLDENGFDVAQALVGTEGTCVAVLEATVKLIDLRPKRTLVVLGYDSVYEAADHVPQIMQHRPVGLEGIDHKLVGYMKEKGLHPKDVELFPEGKGWLLVEFGEDTKEAAEEKLNKLIKELKETDNSPRIKTFDDPWEEQKIWEVRESGLGATAHVPTMAEANAGWEDAAVAPENVGKYLRQFRKLLDEFGYDCALYGHFGQGCIHCRITFDLQTEPGVQHYLKFIDRAADLVIENRGSLSGEHGDGQARAALLPKLYGERLVEAFEKFKAIWDPNNRMNPGKVVAPYLPNQNLRHGPKHYRPLITATTFQFSTDGGSFAKAADRCVGVGKCRRDEGGVMCPSYMATHEEVHSTRGRARLLFEMLQGDVIEGWRDKHVLESLDLCLACKGCKHECPVNVDMATYKAEFMSQHYRWRLRPRQAYAMGLIYWWARIASKMPKIANYFATTKPFSRIAKWAGNISQDREMPTFSSPTFRNWYDQQDHTEASSVDPNTRQDKQQNDKLRKPINNGKVGTNGAPKHSDIPRFQTDSFSEDRVQHRMHPSGSRQTYISQKVMFWPDTFNNYLGTDAAKATYNILRELNYEVILPPRVLCCGRPLYDFGMLDTAKRLLQQIVHTLRPWIIDGTPIVGIEPSCVAVFRDELTDILPHDEDAKRLSRQVFQLSEFLHMQNESLPRLHRKALVHGHCHHKSVMHMDAEVAVMKELELEYKIIDASCCGMAGSFGFAADHYDVSVKIGEQSLLPEVRNADQETLIIANGFSCQQQVKQLTDRTPLHIAQVIELAFQQQVRASQSESEMARARLSNNVAT